MFSKQFKLAVDLDGVLADFDRRAIEILGDKPSKFKDKEMWPKLFRADPNFFENLPWCPDGKELWNSIKHLNPPILTGVPHGKHPGPQKRAWCARELGENVPVLTCMARDKAKFAMEYVNQDTLEGCILIDDRQKWKHVWEQKGGVFLTHKNTNDTLAQLRNMGVI